MNKDVEETLEQLNVCLFGYQVRLEQIVQFLDHQRIRIELDPNLTLDRKWLCHLLVETKETLMLTLQRTYHQLLHKLPIRPLNQEDSLYLAVQRTRELDTDTKALYFVPLLGSETQTIGMLYQQLAQQLFEWRSTYLLHRTEWVDEVVMNHIISELSILREQMVATITPHIAALRLPFIEKKVSSSRKKKISVQLVSGSSTLSPTVIPCEPHASSHLPQTDLASYPVLFVRPSEAHLLLIRASETQQAYHRWLCQGRDTCYRGPVFIYATKHPIKKAKSSDPCLRFTEIPIGKIVGMVELVDCKKPSQEKTQLWEEWQQAGHPQGVLKKEGAVMPLWFQKGMTWLWKFQNPIWRPLENVDAQGIKPWRGGAWMFGHKTK